MTIVLTFDPLYNREASIAKIDSTGLPLWEGTSYSIDTDVTFSLDVSNTNNLFDATDAACNYDGGVIVIPSVQTNIYLLTSITVTNFIGCKILSPNPTTDDYNGLASLVDGITGAEGTLLAVMTNGTNSVFSIMAR